MGPSEASRRAAASEASSTSGETNSDWSRQRIQERWNKSPAIHWGILEINVETFFYICLWRAPLTCPWKTRFQSQHLGDLFPLYLTTPSLFLGSSLAAPSDNIVVWKNVDERFLTQAFDAGARTAIIINCYFSHWKEPGKEVTKSTTIRNKIVDHCREY